MFFACATDAGAARLAVRGFLFFESASLGHQDWSQPLSQLLPAHPIPLSLSLSNGTIISFSTVMARGTAPYAFHTKLQLAAATTAAAKAAAAAGAAAVAVGAAQHTLLMKLHVKGFRQYAPFSAIDCYDALPHHARQRDSLEFAAAAGTAAAKTAPRRSEAAGDTAGDAARGAAAEPLEDRLLSFVLVLKTFTHEDHALVAASVTTAYQYYSALGVARVVMYAKPSQAARLLEASAALRQLAADGRVGFINTAPFTSYFNFRWLWQVALFNHALLVFWQQPATRLLFFDHDEFLVLPPQQQQRPPLLHQQQSKAAALVASSAPLLTPQRVQLHASSAAALLPQQQAVQQLAAGSVQRHGSKCCALVLKRHNVFRTDPGSPVEWTRLGVTELLKYGIRCSSNLIPKTIADPNLVLSVNHHYPLTCIDRAHKLRCHVDPQEAYIIQAADLFAPPGRWKRPVELAVPDTSWHTLVRAFIAGGSSLPPNINAVP